MPHNSPRDTLLSALGAITSLVTPAKRVEDGDRRLERAQALFEEHRAVMNSHDRDLAQSLLE